MCSARRSLRMRASRKDEAFQQPLIRALCTRNGTDTSCRHREVALCAAASFGRRVAVLRCDQPLFLEPIERGVERTWRWVAVCALGDFAPDRDPIGVVVQAKNGKQHDLLEFTEGRRVGHLNYIVVLKPPAASSRNRRPGQGCPAATVTITR